MISKFKSKGVRILAGLLLLSLIVLALYFYIPTKFSRKLTMETAELPPPGSRILIVAPHCDDETLGPGILLHRALDAGREVKVLLVTNGDGFTLAVEEDFFTLHPSSKEYREFGYQRQRESIAALKKLGMKAEDIIFLGYPDTGIARMWTEFWDGDHRYFSKFTQTDVSPYKDSFDKNAPYTGVSLLSDLDKVISEYRPTHIYLPHPNDRHPDHWGVNAFIKYLLEQKQLKNIEENLYLVHRGNWPTPKLPSPGMELYPPAKLTGIGTQWQKFPLLAGEPDLKREAILKYRTQIRAMRSFLLAFVRSSELFGKYPDFILPRKNQILPETRKDTLAIADAKEDTATRDVDRGADLTAINSYVAEKNWVVEIAAAGSVKKSLVYRVHGRLFFAGGLVKRFDFTCTQGSVSLLSYAGNSIKNLPGLQVEEVGGRWRIKVPLKDIEGARTVFLNADCAAGYLNIDKTAWRMLRFQ